MILGDAPSYPLRVSKFDFDPARRMLTKDGVTITLTPTETKVLLVLSSKINKVSSREEIVTTGWGSYDYYKGRSMDVYISRIRKYLASDPALSIITIHSIGFSLIQNSAG